MSIKATYELRHEHYLSTGWWWVIYISEDSWTEAECYSCKSHEEAIAVLKELREEAELGKG